MIQGINRLKPIKQQRRSKAIDRSQVAALPGHLGPTNAAPIVQLKGRREPSEAWVLDMMYSTHCDATPVKTRKKSAGRLDFTPEASADMIRALTKASTKMLQVHIKTVIGIAEKIFVDQVVSVSVEPTKRPDAKSDFAIFKVKLLDQVDGHVVTMLTVKFGRNDATAPTRHWFGLQANPTTLLSGQNVWPVERLSSNDIKHRLTMLGYPYLVLATICRAADPTFVCPAILNPANSGDAVIQNLQFAIPLPIAAEHQAAARAILASTFDMRRIRSAKGKIEAFNIGEYLRIKCDSVIEPTGNGASRVATATLRKKSGTHDLGSVSFYDKVLLQRLSPGQAVHRGMADLQRVDVTLQTRGIEKLLGDAKRLSKSHGVETELDLDAKGVPLRTGNNVIAAITMIDKLFAADFDGRSYRGFVNWLRLRILFDEFHLHEIFGSTHAKRQKVEQHFIKLGAKDKAYLVAWRAWCDSDVGGPDLAACMKAAKINPRTVERQMLKVRALGCSGKLPPAYWTAHRAMSMTWGASDTDLGEFNRRIGAGKSVKQQVAQHNRQLKPTLEALWAGLCSPGADLPSQCAPLTCCERQVPVGVRRLPSKKLFNVTLKTPTPYAEQELDIARQFVGTRGGHGNEASGSGRPPLRASGWNARSNNSITPAPTVSIGGV